MKVLTYHNIGKPPKGAHLKSMYISERKLKAQLWLLKRLGFKGVFPESASFEGREVILTFDDGYLDFLEKAMPLLESYGFSSIVFIVVDKVGSYNEWDAEKLRVKKALMDWQDIEYLVKRGVKIGSHTLTHPFLTQIDPQDAWKEIEHSKKKLEDRLSCPVDYFCYPYGDYNEHIKEMVKRAGYRYAFTTREGSFERGDDPYEIRRMNIPGNMSLLGFFVRIWF